MGSMLEHGRLATLARRLGVPAPEIKKLVRRGVLPEARAGYYRLREAERRHRLYRALVAGTDDVLVTEAWRELLALSAATANALREAVSDAGPQTYSKLETTGSRFWALFRIFTEALGGSPDCDPDFRPSRHRQIYQQFGVTLKTLRATLRDQPAPTTH